MLAIPCDIVSSDNDTDSLLTMDIFSSDNNTDIWRNDWYIQ